MKGIKLHLLIGILKMFIYENASWPCPNGTLSGGHIMLQVCVFKVFVYSPTICVVF